VTDRY